MSEVARASRPFKATLSKGRNSLCVIFKHPVRPGPDGKAGLRIRRGLGTEDETEAQRLVDELNVLISDKQWHTPSAEQAAKARFNPRVVSAFYYRLLPVETDPWTVREKCIPVPRKEDGYCRVRLLGATGAGKTTLLRQLMGTSAEERFPSTSTAKTTTSEFEAILSPAAAEFKAVVTFLSRDHVRFYIEECVTRALITAVVNSDPRAIERDLLEHTEQRFRLKYMLGSIHAPNARMQAELCDEDEDLIEETDEDQITDAEHTSLGEFLSGVITFVQRLAEQELAQAEGSLGFTLESSNVEQRGDILERIERDLQSSTGFHEIVDELFDAVARRFTMFDYGQFNFGSNDWPEDWTCVEQDRARFLRSVKWFASNQAGLFGKLLTPLVSGIRVSGPFQSPLAEHAQNLVIMDGEGLGHAASVLTSISTDITRRYSEADTILLVDNAAQPLLNGPVVLIKNLVTSGQDHKLVVAFTHFDVVKGANLPTVESRKQHLLASLRNAVNAIGQNLGDRVVATLRDRLEARTVFLSNIQREIDTKAKLTRSEFSRLYEVFKYDIRPLTPAEVHPVYDEANLFVGLQSAVSQFRDPWRARLGLPARASLKKEHWGRIKALARRFAHFGTVQYDDLQPVADFLERLNERLTVFLGAPVRWIPDNPPPNLQREAIAQIQRELSGRLMPLSFQRFRDDQLPAWGRAYNHTGHESASRRASEIETILHESAPIIGEAAETLSTRLIDEVRRVFREAVKAGGGRIHQSYSPENP